MQGYQITFSTKSGNLAVANTSGYGTMAKFFPLMAYSSLKVKGPVFMGTGGKDADVPPAGQERLFKDACAAGSVIEHKVYPDLDHSGTVNGSLADSTPFVKRAFAGEALTGNCATTG